MAQASVIIYIYIYIYDVCCFFKEYCPWSFIILMAPEQQQSGSWGLRWNQPRDSGNWAAFGVDRFFGTSTVRDGGIWTKVDYTPEN